MPSAACTQKLVYGTTHTHVAYWVQIFYFSAISCHTLNLMAFSKQSVLRGQFYYFSILISPNWRKTNEKVHKSFFIFTIELGKDESSRHWPTCSALRLCRKLIPPSFDMPSELVNTFNLHRSTPERGALWAVELPVRNSSAVISGPVFSITLIELAIRMLVASISTPEKKTKKQRGS